MQKDRFLEQLRVLILGVAWIGIWGVWIPAASVSLRQNSIDLAEWATFLPEIRSGAFPIVPDILRLSVALFSVAIAWNSLTIHRMWMRWAVVLFCFLPGFLLMPPYPFVLQLWNSESYGLRFVIASLTVIGVGTSVIAAKLPNRVRRMVVTGLTLAAIGTALYAYPILRGAFSTRFETGIGLGWGYAAFITGAILSLVLEASTFFPDNLLFHRSLKTKTGQTP